MNSKKMVLCEIDLHGDLIRIFRFRKQAYQFPVEAVTELPHGVAVGRIRAAVWRRCKGQCELCDKPVSKLGGHMHESHPRGELRDGNYGEYSVENSLFVCPDCHRDEHKNQNWQTSKGPE